MQYIKGDIMQSIINTIVYNIEMIGAFMLPFILLRTADILFGVLLSIRDERQHFELKKLINGIVTGAIAALGIIFLGCGIVLLPELLDVFNITLVDTEILSSMVNVASIIGVIVASIVTYGKDAYQKMLKIFAVKEHEVVKSTRIDENGDEDVRYS